MKPVNEVVERTSIAQSVNEILNGTYEPKNSSYEPKNSSLNEQKDISDKLPKFNLSSLQVSQRLK